MSDLDDARSTATTWFDHGDRVLGEMRFEEMLRRRAERRDACDRLMDWAVAMEHEMERLEAERRACMAARNAAVALAARSGEIRIKDIAARLQISTQQVHAIEREHPQRYHRCRDEDLRRGVWRGSAT